MKNVVLGVTGSVAIYKSCDIIRRLKENGCDVTVVMTKEAKEFINPILFQTLSGNKVYESMFEVPENWDIEHISLAQKADLVLIAPATANIIAKAACGLCDDLLSCIVLATKAKIVFCPAMNDGMFLNKITQANIKKLSELNCKFIQPVKGKLACGKVGIGCLADVDTIVKAVLAT